MYLRFDRLAALLALIAMVVATGCRSNAVTCRTPTTRERVYPYTGVWSRAEANDVCLYQADARLASGVLAGHRVVGLINPDGSMHVAVDQPDGVALVVLRVRGDTLIKQLTVANTADGVTMADTTQMKWVRPTQ